MTLESLCRSAADAGASDLILLGGRAPVLRVEGALRDGGQGACDAALDELWRAVGAPDGSTDFDAALVFPDGLRFRANLFRQLGARAAVLRLIRSEIPALDALGVPPVVRDDWLARRSGIVLVTGPTGSGKTTTLAACLDHVNRNAAKHVVTIEDPVEFVFAPAGSVFSQRDVGIDTPSFAQGLRQALRQSPDIIMIGEIRDAESAATALRAAETGHLILATVHGASARDALDRAGQLFSEGAASHANKVFASQLVGVLCQRLLPAAGGGLVLAAEFFTNAGATRKYIEESRFGDLADYIERADTATAISLMQSIAALCRAGRVSEETALAAVESPAELTRALRGISNQPSRR